MTRPRIAVVDDEEIIRDGIAAVLSDRHDVAAFPSADLFLDHLDQGAATDCLLLDLRMPERDGAWLQDRLQQRKFHAPVIFMSGDALKTDIIDAWRGGAADFLLKPFTPSELTELVEKHLAMDRGRDGGTSGPTDAAVLPITRREAQVLALIAAGLQQHEIARELGLSLRTVKMYRAFLKNKLNLNSIVEVARFYDRNRNNIQKLIR